MPRTATVSSLSRIEVPIHPQAVDGASAAGTGLLLLPLTAAVGIGSLATDWLVTRTGRLAILRSLGHSVAAIGLLLVAFFSRDFSAGWAPGVYRRCWRPWRYSRARRCR